MTAPATALPAARPSLWHNRDFLALWGGQIVSTLGSRTSATALPLLVLALTGSATDAGIVGAAATAPYVASLPAGALVDRWDRKRILVVSELVAGVALAGIPVAMWLHVLTVPQLAGTAFAQGCCSVFFGLAEHASLPRIVEDSQLSAAIAQNEAKSRGASLVGPPLGGLLYGLSRALPFLADAISYAVSTAALLLVTGDLRAERAGPRQSLGRETAEGLRWLWRQPFARAVVALVAVSNMVFQALVLVLIVLVEREGAPSSAVGLMLGVYGGGGLLGALVAARLHGHVTAKAVVIGTNWVWAALLPLMMLTSNPLLLGLIGGAGAFLGPLWNVVMMSYQLTLVPPELMGRVGSAVMTVCWGVLPLASLGGGYLLSAAGPTGSVLVLTALMAATAVAATVSPTVRGGAGQDGMLSPVTGGPVG